MTITNWIWLFSGFTESRREVCGTERLFFALRQHEARDKLIEFDEWDADPEGVAAFIARNSGARPGIVIAGYSWGGNKAIATCRALAVHRLSVSHLILCDAVYRTNWQPEWMARRGVPLNPLSLMRLAQLHVPGNVRRWTWFRQRVDPRIQGHDVVPEDADRTGYPATLLNRSHGEMDEAPEFHRAVLAAAGELHSDDMTRAE